MSQVGEVGSVFCGVVATEVDTFRRQPVAARLAGCGLLARPGGRRVVEQTDLASVELVELRAIQVGVVEQRCRAAP